MLRMRRVGAVAVVAVAAAFHVPDVLAADPLKVVIVRHGEKPASGDNLSCQGENRALQLPAVLLSKFGKPDYTYVPSLDLGKSSKHARMFQTVSPMAIKLNLVVNSRFAEADVSGAAADIRKRTGVVLVVWEHSQIPALATALGVGQSPSWSGDDFDSIWVLTYDAGAPSLSTDSEGLTPPPKCRF